MNPAYSQGMEAPVASPVDLAGRAALGDFSPEVIGWLCEGMRRHVVDGAPLDAALQLDRASRIRVRDDALRRAAALLVLGDEGSWTVAGRLVQAIVRQERKRDTPETPLETAVAAALASGVRVPTTQRQIFAIITA